MSARAKVGDLHPLDPAYPLGDEWLANDTINPRIAGYAAFEDGCRAAARGLLYGKGERTVSIDYGCLSHFRVRIDAPPEPWDWINVSVAIGTGPARSARYDLLTLATWELVARAHKLLDDDARAVTYLLRGVGRAIATIGEGSGDGD